MKLVLILLLCVSAQAQWVITSPAGPPASCGSPGVTCLADCQNITMLNAAAAASEGNTLILPVCTNTTPGLPPGGTGTAVATNEWNTAVRFTKKHVNIVGQGVGQTVIINSVPQTGCNTVAVQFAALITFDDTTNTSPWGNILNSSTPGLTDPIRVSGMTIQQNTISTASACSHLGFVSGSHQLRVDHINFSFPNSPAQLNNTAIYIDGDVWGVIDHVTNSGLDSDNNQHRIIFLKHDMWGAVGNYADNDWAQPSTIGTVQQVTVEDSTFINNSVIWCEFGARCTARYSTFSAMGTHGTESNERFRSGRHQEVYNNTFNCNPNQGNGVANIHSFRGGSLILFNNNVTRDGSTNCGATTSNLNMTAMQYRTFRRYRPWGPLATTATPYIGSCDGTGVWDKNMPLALSGTADGSSTKDHLVVSPSPNWTTNQWQGYLIHNVTGAGSAVDANGNLCSPAFTIGPWGSLVLSSTANSITTQPAGVGCIFNGVNYGENTWTAGDTFELRQGGICIDNIGYGAGALIDGYPTYGTPWTCTAGGTGRNCIANPNASESCVNGQPTWACGWVNEQLEPVYSWNNIITNTTTNTTSPFGVTIEFGAGVNPVIKYNEEVYNQNPLFDGNATINNLNTGGVGVGLFSARPPTCTPQVGYWATDQNTLYWCSAPNTWTVHYQPLAYPHPFTLSSTMARDGRVIETADGHTLIKLASKPIKPRPRRARRKKRLIKKRSIEKR